MPSDFLQLPCRDWFWYQKRLEVSLKLFSVLQHLMTVFNSGPYPAAVTWMGWLQGLSINHQLSRDLYQAYLSFCQLHWNQTNGWKTKKKYKKIRAKNIIKYTSSYKKIMFNSGIIWLHNLLADFAETRVPVPSESCHLGTLNENRRVRKGLTIKVKTKKSWTQWSQWEICHWPCRKPSFQPGRTSSELTFISVLTAPLASSPSLNTIFKHQDKADHQKHST